MDLLHDTQNSNWTEIEIDMTQHQSETAALQELTNHCHTAIHGAMTKDPTKMDADQMAKTKESVVALTSYAKENGLHQALLKLEIIKADLDQRFLTAFGRENEWRMVGNQLNQHTNGALAERLTATGSNPDLRLAADFVTKPS